MSQKENKEQNEEKNIKFDSYNKLIFKKYQILKKMDETKFNSVFLGMDTRSNKMVVIKCEKRISSLGLLEKEAYFLYYLKGFGIPEIISFGTHGKYFILVEQFLGKSLKELFKTTKNKLKDLCMATIQIIDRLEYIHSKYIIHRDIKPENFVVGNPDTSIIYLIDFGLAKKYRSSRTGNHLKSKKNLTTSGTILYLSLNSMIGLEPSRRDDLESVGYMLISLYYGKLPWNQVKAKNKMDFCVKTYYIKKYIEYEKLCDGISDEITEYMKYVKSLKYDQKPDYNFLRNLFINCLKKNNEENNLAFSWVSLNKTNFKTYNILKNFNKRKTSLRTRILKNINNKYSRDLSEEKTTTKHLSHDDTTHKKINFSQQFDYEMSLNGINNKKKNFETQLPNNKIVFVNHSSKNSLNNINFNDSSNRNSYNEYKKINQITSPRKYKKIKNVLRIPKNTLSKNSFSNYFTENKPTSLKNVVIKNSLTKHKINLNSSTIRTNTYVSIKKRINKNEYQRLTEITKKNNTLVNIPKSNRRCLYLRKAISKNNLSQVGFSPRDNMNINRNINYINDDNCSSERMNISNKINSIIKELNNLNEMISKDDETFSKDISDLKI